MYKIALVLEMTFFFSYTFLVVSTNVTPTLCVRTRRRSTGLRPQLSGLRPRGTHHRFLHGERHHDFISRPVHSIQRCYTFARGDKKHNVTIFERKAPSWHNGRKRISPPLKGLLYCLFVDTLSPYAAPLPNHIRGGGEGLHRTFPPSLRKKDGIEES